MYILNLISFRMFPKSLIFICASSFSAPLSSRDVGSPVQGKKSSSIFLKQNVRKVDDNFMVSRHGKKNVCLIFNFRNQLRKELKNLESILKSSKLENSSVDTKTTFLEGLNRIMMEV